MINIDDKNSSKLNETQVRTDKLIKLQRAGINCFEEKFDVSYNTEQLMIIGEKGDLKTSEELLKNGVEKKYSIAGRVMSFRSHGKLSFAKLKDFNGQIQLCFVKDYVKVIKGDDVLSSVIIDSNDISAYKFIEKYIDIGDFIGVNGELFVTNHGELTLFVNEFQLLTKTLHPLPEKFHGIQDIESRLRKRYLDIVMNDDIKNMIVRRSKYFNAFREFLLGKGFLEVDTPILEITTGGADANPFATYHNALDIDVYLRISVGELWQKRLMIAGLEKTFEIGRVFRNEGMSPEHAQDYISMEMYRSYADYKQMMSLVKEMYLYLIDTVYGKRKFTIRGYEVDFDKEWEYIDYKTIIKQKTGIDIFNDDLEDIEDKLKELKVKYEAGNRARMVDYLWKYCRKQIAGPVFLINEPKFTSPLAKSDPKNPEITHRFHVIIAGSELGNGYSELNDPLDQKERFEIQQNLRQAGDDEAQMADRDYVEALMHGMPPTAGFGISERLFAFLEDKPIREVQTFPLMKPIESDEI